MLVRIDMSFAVGPREILGLLPECFRGIFMANGNGS